MALYQDDSTCMICPELTVCRWMPRTFNTELEKTIMQIKAYKKGQGEAPDAQNTNFCHCHSSEQSCGEGQNPCRGCTNTQQRSSPAVTHACVTASQSQWPSAVSSGAYPENVLYNAQSAAVTEACYAHHIMRYIMFPHSCENEETLDRKELIMTLDINVGFVLRVTEIPSSLIMRQERSLFHT